MASEGKRCLFPKWSRSRVSPNHEGKNKENSEAKRVCQEVVFTINGKQYTANGSIPTDTSLNTFIRNHANLRGTKSMCHEGGCGACIVAVTSLHPVTKEETTYAVNSCLISIFSCHEWAITTVEGIGNKKDGYHPVQTRLAHLNGTQCGYCTPGMVMNMYSLLEGKELTMKEVENSFGGNICRCTGYRPILDAFKSMCVDATPELKEKCQDIEDIHNWKICPKNGQSCRGTCKNGTSSPGSDDQNSEITSVHLELQGAEWYKVWTTAEIFDIFSKIGDVPYMLMAGNTGNGVYRRTISPKVYIDVNGVKELKNYSVGSILTLGGNMSLTEAMTLFYALSNENTEYAYTKVLADHIDLIANVPVRNTGTIAGNLSMKHENREFPSDMFLMLETVGATLNIMEDGGRKLNVSMLAYLDLDMKKRIIHSIVLPPLDQTYSIRTFKIMPRAQNAHAYVNAGFLFKLNKRANGNVLEKPTIVFGGITPEFLHATEMENYLQGKNLFDQKILRNALKVLDSELHPDHILPDATPAYRRGLAEGLFYKFVLGVASDRIKAELGSGGELLTRVVSSGKQDYESDWSLWPLNKPIPKLEALVQCSGEAQYVNDLPAIANELFAAFALTRLGQGTIARIDTSEALSIPGVVAFLGAKDIPGKNCFIPPMFGLPIREEVFCSSKISYAGQPVGVVVAETQQIANRAALLVKIEYANVSTPVVSIKQAIATQDEARIIVQHNGEAKNKEGLDDVTHVIKGKFVLGSQYHYTMEPQSCVCIPTEDGIDVYPATQWMDLIQIAISEALNMSESRINVNIRRLGGGYGAKISRSSQIATACAIAAHVLNKPVRLVMSLESNMESMGKRISSDAEYEVGVDDEGKIKYLKADFYQDYGCNINDGIVPYTMEHMHSCYQTDTWSIRGIGVITDTPSNTYCRAPGSTEGIGFIEQIMEHIAKVLDKDPIEVRINNMEMEDNPLPELVQEMKESCNYEERKQAVEEFNQINRWKKRGISVVTMKYPFTLFGGFQSMVSIYSYDGTVAVTHGGIECGQGINTKIAQVCAHILGVPLEHVCVKPSNTFTAPNGMVTGGSVASEACAYATIMACKELLCRLEPVKKGLDDPTWQELVQAAYQQNVNLCAAHMFGPSDGVKPYNIFGVTIGEVEVDVLTGQHEILRVDILEDTGQSMSPEVDIGQIEGAFIMGLGYWLMEYLTFDTDTGELLTNRTWNYKPPGVKDIPIDFRVQFRRNAPNPHGVLRSKATGEPPLCMSCVIPFAIRNALDSARRDAGHPEVWYNMNAPFTAENIFLNSLTSFDQFTY